VIERRELEMRTSAAILMSLLISCMEPALARGVHNHGGTRMPHGGGDLAGGSEASGEGHRHGNNAYGKAKVEEKDRLLGKLKSICRGC
jgi:hypothetical protein